MRSWTPLMWIASPAIVFAACGGTHRSTEDKDAGGQLPCAFVLCGSSCVDTSLDVKNCGSCGRDCMGGDCLDGWCKPVVLASDLISPFEIAVDAASVYWTDHGGGFSGYGAQIPGAVVKMPLSGGSATTLATGKWGDFAAGAIALDATSVYWVNDAGGTGGGIWNVPLGGGTPMILGTGGGESIAVDATSVYWSESEFCGEGCSYTNLQKAPLAGGKSTIVMGPLVAWSVFAIAVDAENIYWTDPQAGAVMSMPLDRGGVNMRVNGGGPSTLASGQNGPAAIAIDGTSVYWTNADGTIAKTALKGGTPTTLLAQMSCAYCAPANHIAVDATTVYWTSNGRIEGDGVVVTVPIDGGPATTLATSQDNPDAITVDAKCVYWANRGWWNRSGALMKIAKP